MTEFPSGTVTFLFTDLEGSTRFREHHGETLLTALVMSGRALGRLVSLPTGGPTVPILWISLILELVLTVWARLSLRRRP